MKHLKILQNVLSYNTWRWTNNYVTPNVIKYSNNNQLTYEKYTQLPYDAILEYLENGDNNCYIDTGISTDNSNVGIDCIVNFGNYEHNKWSIGYNFYQAGDSAGFQIGLYNDKLYGSTFNRWKNGGASVSVSYDNTNKNDWYHITLNCLNVSAKINDVKSDNEQLNTYGPNGGNIFLYCRNGNLDKVSDAKVGTRIASVKLYENNNTLIRDFIPVRKNGVGYMYDKITNQLFGNDGTGEFILGPDK